MICQNCGRPFERSSAAQVYELDCSDICRANSRKRRKALGLSGQRNHVVLRRVYHVLPVQPQGRRWLMVLWPPYRRRAEREARLVWFGPEAIAGTGVAPRDRLSLHSPPERCQECGVPVLASTRATRTKGGYVYCSPEHLAAARPLPEPLPVVCPRPDKQGRYRTRREAEKADPIRLRGIDRMEAYQCACAWWHLGKAADWGATIGARATVRRWDGVRKVERS